jgi:YVTN family beta-propeller protein
MKTKTMLILTLIVPLMALPAAIAIPRIAVVNAFAQEITEDRGTVWVANGMEDSLSAINISSGKVESVLEVGVNPHILNASPDGKILYIINAGAHDREPGAHGTDNNTSAQLNQQAHKNETTNQHGTMSGTGSMEMASEASANSLWAIDTEYGDIIARVPVGEGPTHPMPSFNGQWVYVTNTDGDSVSVIDTGTWKVVKTVRNISEPHDGELTPDGSLLYLATSGDSTLTVVDTKTLKVAKTIPVGKKPRGVAVGGNNGEIAYVTNKGDGTLSVIDVPSGLVKDTLIVGQGAHALRVSPDGKRVYIALSKENAVAIVDPTHLKVLKKIPVGKLPEQIDLSRDGKWLFASNNAEASMSIINIERRKVTKTVSVGEGAYGVQAVPIMIQARRGSGQSAMLILPKNADGYSDITVSALSEMMGNKNFTLVNVHIPYQGEIPETDLLIPFNKITSRKNLKELPDKDAPIVLYCRSGSMSTVAANELTRIGYNNIIELDGGFNAWNTAGLEFLNMND